MPALRVRAKGSLFGGRSEPLLGATTINLANFLPPTFLGQLSQLNADAKRLGLPRQASSLLEATGLAPVQAPSSRALLDRAAAPGGSEEVVPGGPQHGDVALYLFCFGTVHFWPQGGICPRVQPRDNEGRCAARRER